MDMNVGFNRGGGVRSNGEDVVGGLAIEKKKGAGARTERLLKTEFEYRSMSGKPHIVDEFTALDCRSRFKQWVFIVIP